MNQTYHPNDAVSSPRYVTGTPDWVKPHIDQASQKYNVPPVLLSALLKQESGFNPRAQSPVGAQGIAQFMPSTAKGRGVNPWDPNSAIQGAAQYLRQGLDKYGGDTSKALAAYNAGFGAVDRFKGVPPYKETQGYVKNILAMTGDIHQSFAGPTLDLVNQAKKAATTVATLPNQVSAITQMNPQLAAQYRQQVAQTVPTIPVNQVPSAFLNGILPGAGSPLGRSLVNSAVNVLPNSVIGMASLPAARSPWQALGDLAQIGAGAGVGASLLNQTGLLSRVNPAWFGNQFGQVPLGPQQNLRQTPIEKIQETVGGWQPGDRVKFDWAVFQNDFKTIKEMLPRVPADYLINRFGPMVYQKLLGAVGR